MDPRTSTPRDIEACRSPVVPQVRRFAGVPRAVFEVCSASPPVDFPFQAPRLTEGRLSTANGPKRCPAHLTVPAAAVSEAQRRAERHAGTKRLGPPAGTWRRISDAPNRPPLPAPRLETRDQTPLGHEGGMKRLIS